MGCLDDRLSIRRSDLGDKGIWYRVIMGQFDDLSDAKNMASALEQKGLYARPMDFASAGLLF
ncbi:MAG: SPOR domain-containing protein [Desulfobacter sp.]|nr:SPOR domain-containing protein [Desulfobacter sp.]